MPRSSFVALVALVALSISSCSPAEPRATAPSVARVSASAAASPDPEPPALRLSALAKPSRYDLDLTVDPDAARFAGVIAADVDVIESTKVIWLNATDLTIAGAEITVAGATRSAR